VTYRGRPVAGAAVAFLAQGVSRPASGDTNDSGEFRLTTFEPNDGAVAGAHTVTVTKFSEQPAPPPPPVEQSPDQEVDPAVIEKAMREHVQRVEKARSELPLKYANFNTSDLRFEVVRGENDFNIQLVD
jgi:hypothetical protein